MITKAKDVFSNAKDLTQEEYIAGLEATVIFLSKCYKNCYDTFAYNKGGKDFTKEEAFNNHMHFPLIQGTMNSMPVIEMGKMKVPKNNVSIWQISDIIEEKYENNL